MARANHHGSFGHQPGVTEYGWIKRYMHEGWRPSNTAAPRHNPRPKGGGYSQKSSAARFKRLDRLQADAVRTAAKAKRAAAPSRIFGAIMSVFQRARDMFRTMRKSG